ncbi:MAG TPA: hypothetical protein VD887_05480 [Allosphingosinicella sp.]|nr:hypothetical protein [Allosphingosinicella sp.]
MGAEFEQRTQDLEANSPHRFEVGVLAVAAAAGWITVVAILLKMKQLRDSAAVTEALQVAAVWLTVIGIAIWLSRWVLRHRLLFLTLDDPSPLVDHRRRKGGMGLDDFIEALEQGELPTPVQEGGAGVVHFLKGVERAPALVQYLAKGFVTNAQHILVFFLSYVACIMLSSGLIHATLTNLLFLLLLFNHAFRLRLLHDPRPFNSRSLPLIIVAMTLLPLTTMIVPQENLPLIEVPNTTVQTSVIFVCYAVVALLFVRAIKEHFGAGHRTNPAYQQVLYSTQTLPDDIYREIGRQIVAAKPQFSQGRLYVDRPPRIASDAARGSFAALMLAESRPEIRGEALPPGHRQIFATPRLRWLGTMTVLSGVAWIAFFAAGWLLASEISANRLPWWKLMWMAAFASIASYAQYSAHLLWARFDYLSDLVLVRMHGNFSRSAMSIGNTIRGSLQAQRENIVTENLEISIWYTGAQSLSFGIKGTRMIHGYLGDRPRLHSVLKGVSDFLGGQASIVAPHTEADAARAAEFGRLSALLSGKPPDQDRRLERRDSPAKPLEGPPGDEGPKEPGSKGEDKG